MPSRRDFLQSAGVALGGLAGTSALAASTAEPGGTATQVSSLCGRWLFRTDPNGAGEREKWYSAEARDWAEVTVPHTWQVEPPLAAYRGLAWYRRGFDVRPEWRTQAVRIEFEAVFHSATVWINGELAGEHPKRGYTAFDLDITRLLRWDSRNIVTVLAGNAPEEDMLPRGESSDWALDGGIYRPVQLLITPQVFFERADVDASPNPSGGDALVDIAAYVRNSTQEPWSGAISLRILDAQSGLVAAAKEDAARLAVGPESTASAKFAVSLPRAELWHFDHPHLYDLELTLAGGHRLVSTFGVRKFETREGGLYLNGERVRLMGVERMAGGNPEFGMAETEDWIRHDHADLKNLNCVFTRVHWPQDRRVLDYCDRHGIFIQTEVPAWGPDTFAGMTGQPSQAILQNGFEQLREMIARDRNHPCICSWGVCNETNGQNPPAYAFAKEMYAEAKRLDPHRLVSYASNSLFHTPGDDVAGLMDFVMMNEYYGSWQKGTPEDLAKTLDTIHAAFPGKAIVISEYGYCACTADRPEGDQRRAETLVSQDRVFRERDYVCGAIFFCYNDYRTHIGDRGLGVMRQRVHGVVDLCGERKASYEILRTESSPILSLNVEGNPKSLKLTVQTRKHLPAYTLRGYRVRGTYYGEGGIPVERMEAGLPDLAPGEETSVTMNFSAATPLRIVFDVLRPTGSSAFSLEWRL